jgi:hypothetical protein
MPSCFISYSWESDIHRGWVRALAERLQSAGVEIRFDQWDLFPGSDLLHFMETSVRESDYVLLVCTPSFAAKANAGSGGVGYEKTVVSGELFYANGKPGKFVPILRLGEPAQALPSYLLSKVFVDFRDDANFERSCEELLQHLHGITRYLRPPLGPTPVLGKDRHPTFAERSPTLNYCSRCGAKPGRSSTCTGGLSHHSFAKGTTQDYCSRCGAKPGRSSTCTGGLSHHSFAKGTTQDYCSRCGAKPGRSSTCTGGLSHHSFAKGTTQDYCSRCGAKPGKASTCTGGLSHHSFARGTAQDYCSRCGAKPGKASTCTGGLSHHSFVELGS